MGRYADRSKTDWVPAGTSIVGGYTSPAINMLGNEGASVTIVNAGTTIAGTWQWYATDFGAGDLTPQDLPPNADFVPISGASIAAAAGAQRIEILTTRCKWLQLRFTDSGSSAATAAVALTVRARNEE